MIFRSFLDRSGEVRSNDHQNSFLADFKKKEKTSFMDDDEKSSQCLELDEREREREREREMCAVVTLIQINKGLKQLT